MSGTFAHLCHRAGCRGQLLRIDGLNRVNHCNVGLHGIQGAEDFVQGNFCQDLDLRAVQPQTAGPQRDLGAALFASDIQRALAIALKGVQRLQ